MADWSEIEGTEHNVSTNGAGSCATCHNSPRQEVIDAIALRANPTHCLDCHSDKELTPHGGHDATAFSVGTDGCDDCHTVPAEGVADMHNSSECLMCHTAAGGGYGTARDASAGEMDTYNTNGIDANPILAATGTDTYKSYPGLTCHDATDPDVGSTTLGGFHHNNAGSGGVVSSR